MKEITISAKDIILFILRSGSISGSGGSFSFDNAAWEGTIMHQRVQKMRKKEAEIRAAKYEKEVVLNIRLRHGELDFHITGRADGIITESGEVTIEEIKTTDGNLDRFLADDQWRGFETHWAQAKCYGYMYFVKNPDSIESIRIALTYCGRDAVEFEGDEILTETFVEEYTRKELEQFFVDLIDQYYEFAIMDENRMTEAAMTARNLAFPFTSYRKSQRELAVSVFTAIKREKKLFAQAPTGTGKTISVLYPAVKAVGEGICEKLFYLTAKTTTGKAAEQAFELMMQKGLSFKTITLTAKDKICMLKIGGCNPKICEYADGHYDRINSAIKDIIINEGLITRKTVETYALKHRVCPYEYSLDISLFCDAIICDYNYVYDPRAYLRRYFDKNKSRFALLGDEAHNLVDRAREMYSAELTKSRFAGLRRILEKDTPLYKVTGKIIKYFGTYQKDYLKDKKQHSMNTQPHDMYQLLKDFNMFAEILLKSLEEMPRQNISPVDSPFFIQSSLDGTESFNSSDNDLSIDPVDAETSLDHSDIFSSEYISVYDAVLDIYYYASNFLKISELFDSHYIVIIEGDKTDVMIKLFCIDPSKLLRETQKKVLSSVFFSATLTPLDYFRNILGGEEEDFILRLQSPFDGANMRLIIHGGVSTKYAYRDRSYSSIADSIFCMISGRTGNYFVFFSSYEYMLSVMDIFMQKYPDTDVVAQSKNMNDGDRESFLNYFQPDSNQTLVAFLVLGGVFSEGIDLRGDRLIGVCVVGVGLPMISYERDLIKDYYAAQNDMGFEFAYMYPGMNKVLQAVGRLIRSETDKGVALLIDERFLTSRYVRLFPPEWNYIRINDAKDIVENTAGIWE